VTTKSTSNPALGWPLMVPCVGPGNLRMMSQASRTSDRARPAFSRCSSNLSAASASATLSGLSRIISRIARYIRAEEVCHDALHDSSCWHSPLSNHCVLFVHYATIWSVGPPKRDQHWLGAAFDRGRRPAAPARNSCPEAARFAIAKPLAPTQDDRNPVPLAVGIDVRFPWPQWKGAFLRTRLV
jgi:hypothetical protein